MTTGRLLDDIFGDQGRESPASPFGRFGLSRNPFPGNEEEFFSFVEGQNDSKSLFRTRLSQFTLDRTVSACLVVADHRVGKTNFLRHFHSRLSTALNQVVAQRTSETRLLAFYTNVYEYDFYFLYQQIVDRIPSEFLRDLVIKLREKPLRAEFPSTDLTKALEGAAQGASSTEASLDARIDLFKRWLRGGYRSLSKAERTELGVSENVTNSPVGSRFLRDLLFLLHERGVLDGIVLFLDEFERLVGAGISRGQKDRYLNDLRNFMSDFQKGAFFCFAITPGALQELQRVYPAIPPRLGTQLKLSALTSEQEAISFAKRYVAWFQDQADLPRNARPYGELLPDQQISVIFLRLAQRFGRSVPQGHFLSALRDAAEVVAETSSR